MQFKKYCSIDEKGRTLTIDKYATYGYTDGDWVVTTKIHGANFSVIVGKDELKCARRTGILPEGESFYNYKKVVERYLDKIKKVRELTLKEFDLDPDCVIQLFGELFGGHYPHPDVKNVQGVKKVQDKVWYCPDVDFFPFDIYVRKSDEESFPLDHDVFERIVSEAGFVVYAKSLLTGSFEECLAYPNDYPDFIHKFYDLPEIENNICEGNVLKPVKAACEPSGSRIILKNKNEKFKEREKVKDPKKSKPVHVSEEAKELVVLADEYINENRLRNVVSHFGELTDKDFGKVLGAFSQDVRKDMEGDDPEVFSKIDKEEQKRVNKVINNNCAALMNKNFRNIIDGTF